MLIYEKNNKLNINFDNEVSEQPNVQIGKNEISLDGATISKDSVLPTPNAKEDVGKTIVVSEDGKYELAEAGNPLPVPVLPQDIGKAIIVDKNGSYTLAEAGGGNTITLEITISDVSTGKGTSSMTRAEIQSAISSGKVILPVVKETNSGATNTYFGYYLTFNPYGHPIVVGLFKGADDRLYSYRYTIDTTGNAVTRTFAAMSWESK